MVNFVLSFCRITAASKIFARNFYLPLLKPLTPREAFRTFRITGKWLLGSKIQRYIPVLLNHKKKRSKNAKNYGKLKHEQKSNYSYMTPVFDNENETQKLLRNILEKKKGSGVFVYTVEDKKLNIVLQAQLEYAVRDGDVIDILVSQKTDKVIIKLKDFKKIPLELDYYDEEEPLFCGEGATSEADEKLHHYGKYTMSLAKIFEDKERQEEEWELMLKSIIKRRKRHIAEKRKEYKALVKENLRKLDWDQFEEDAKKVVQEINEIGHEKPIDMEIDDLKKTLGVNDFFSKSDKFFFLLPCMDDITDILENMGSGEMIEVFDAENYDGSSDEIRISGMKVRLSSGIEKFIVGQIVHSEDGEIFVPGQTVRTEAGLEFVPGFTLNIDGKPSLINGLIMAQKDNNPMFLPTQSAITSEGQLTFALSEEERPPPPSEEHIKIRRERREKLMNQIEENINSEPCSMNELENQDSEILVGLDEPTLNNGEVEEAIILLINEKDLIEQDASDCDSGISEIDFEQIELKRMRDREELEELKKIIMNDGMEKLVSDLEDKKLSLQKRLEELHKLTTESQRPLISYVTEKDVGDVSSKISQDDGDINRINDILLTLLRKTSAIANKHNIHSENIIETHVILENEGCTGECYNKCSKSLKILLKSSIVAANKVFKERPKDQLLALEAMGEIFVDILKDNDCILNELLELMNTNNRRSEVFEILHKYLSYDYKNSRVNILSQIINNCPRKGFDETLQNIEKLLVENNRVMCDSFIKLCKLNDDLIHNLAEYCRENSFKVKIENDVVSVLEEGIINTVKLYVDENFDCVVDFNEEEFRNFIEKSVCFAEALEMLDIAESICELNSHECKELGKKEEKFLKRIFLIEKLTNREYSMKKAIERLQKNPDQAKYDPRIRQITRESAVLLSDGLPLSSSRSIPLKLLKSENHLAIEDFIVQRLKIDNPILIIRNEIQVVIPKEALQAVHSGRTPYVLIDESGISNFKPLHNLNLMKGIKNADHATNNNYSKFNCDIDSSKERRFSALSRTGINFS